MINYRGHHTPPIDQLHYIKKLCEDRLRFDFSFILNFIKKFKSILEIIFYQKMKMTMNLIVEIVQLTMIKMKVL
jgi:hypothetical protein